MVHTHTAWQGSAPAHRGSWIRRRPADPLSLRSEAEELLRDVAFVLEATRSLKQALLEAKAAGSNR